MIKKYSKILLINICVIIVFAFLLELFSYLYATYKNREMIFQQWAIKNPIILTYSMPHEFSLENPYYKQFVRTFKQNSSKRTISFVGCSYTRGIYLQDEETFAYLTGKLSNRTVYLRGLDGTGLGYVYYQIMNKVLPEDSEYIIYTYIFDHLKRFYNYQIDFFDPEINLRYELKDGILQEKKSKMPLIFNSLYCVKLFQDNHAYKQFEKEVQEFNQLKAMLKDITVQMKKNYPNSKFVFVNYPQNEEDYCIIPDDVINYIKSLGIIYIDANQITGVQLGNTKYKAPEDNSHPNAEANRLFAEALVKELKL